MANNAFPTAGRFRYVAGDRTDRPWITLRANRGVRSLGTSSVTAGAGWGTAILHAWTEADQALWAGVLNFWFLGRVFDRVRS